MTVLPSNFYQHVVNVYLDISSNLMCEHLVYEPLVRCTHIFEAEWHHFIAEDALASDERHLLLIHFIHFDLVIARKNIHEAQ